MNIFRIYCASLGAPCPLGVFHNEANKRKQRDDRNRQQRKFSKYPPFKHWNHRNQLYISYACGKVSHSICSTRFAVIARQWLPLLVGICFHLFSCVPPQLPSRSPGFRRPLHLYLDPLKSKRAPRYWIASVGRTGCRIPQPMATPESHFLIPVSQSWNQSGKHAGLVVEWAWRFHPQNGWEIARALDSPFKINGRINSRGLREGHEGYASAYIPFSTAW